MGRCILLFVLLAMLPLLAAAQEQQRQETASKTYGIHVEGTLKLMKPDASVIEVRQYLCERVCYPEEQRFTEKFLSWVGEDTDSLLEWEHTFILDGNDFVLEREGYTEGSGSLKGRPWSWAEISFQYTGPDGAVHKFDGGYSGKGCQRAGVVTDADDNLLLLIIDESNTITEAEYAVMRAIYLRIKAGYN